MTESMEAVLVSETELHRTQQPSTKDINFLWDDDTLCCIGEWSMSMAKALHTISPQLKHSFKNTAIEFIKRGDYSHLVYRSCFSAISNSFKQRPTTSFDEQWLSNALLSTTFRRLIGPIRNFFILWNEKSPSSVNDNVLQLIVKAKPPKVGSSNVLSDDPEVSWLTDSEYETILLNVWRNYENHNFSVGRTLLHLLSMQFARRPAQLAQLKIGDFKLAKSGDNSGLTGTVVAFPGVKDIGAATNFRDSKFETHPLPEHIWNLFELQREHLRQLFDSEFGIELSNTQLDDIPVFTESKRIKEAITVLKTHFRLDYRANLAHRIFHPTPQRISKYLTWRPEINRKVALPISHRTGRPIKVTATRMRHTRARQLARKGVPRHVLSHWLGHTSEKSLQAYYNDPAENARQLDEAMAPALVPLAMAFAGTLIDTEVQASRYDDPTSRLEFASKDSLQSVGHCGKHSFCATTSVPVPCYRCKHFEPLVSAPHQEVLDALNYRQTQEKQALRIGGAKNLLVPIDLSADILAVKNCIDRCEARKAEKH